MVKPVLGHINQRPTFSDGEVQREELRVGDRIDLVQNWSEELKRLCPAKQARPTTVCPREHHGRAAGLEQPQQNCAIQVSGKNEAFTRNSLCLSSLSNWALSPWPVSECSGAKDYR